MDSPALTPLHLDDRTVDFQRGSVTDQTGHTVSLRPQTADVLKVLATRPGTLVTKDELMQAVWGDIAVTDDSLVQCIAEIRKALGDEKHEIVRTILKRGYLFGPRIQRGLRQRLGLAIGEARDPGRKGKHHLIRAYSYRLMGKYEESIREYEQAGPMWAYPRLSLAIDYVRLGRLDEARAAVKEAQKANPVFTQTIWREGSFYSDPAILEGELADLAKAGLPEK